VVVQEQAPGKGAAVRTGFDVATCDFVVMIDADGSMDPAEIGRFVDRLQSGYDVVKGSRFMAGGGSTDITRLRRLGNRALRNLVNGLYGERFTDLCYGFFALRRDCVPDLALGASGFEIETEIVVRSIITGMRMAEVPSFEAERLSGTSNLHSVRDGLRVLRTLLVHRVRGASPSDAAVDDGRTVVVDLTATHVG
jgi:glycosyltransferase involved in cell wall biosynthesis